MTSPWIQSKDKKYSSDVEGGRNFGACFISETNRTQFFFFFLSDIFCKIVLIPEFPSQCLVHYTVFTFAVF